MKGIFHNKVITFSSTPQFIDLQPGQNLREKLEILLSYNEVSAVNIETVFDMLLDLAIRNEVLPEELPKQVLIITNMEFNAALSRSAWEADSRKWITLIPSLLETLGKRYKKAGYKIPKLIFWNVCGRTCTGTIPQVKNDEALCLLSGFSQKAMKTAADREKKDSYESLLQILDRPRYNAVEKAIAELVP